MNIMFVCAADCGYLWCVFLRCCVAAFKGGAHSVKGKFSDVYTFEFVMGLNWSFVTSVVVFGVIMCDHFVDCNLANNDPISHSIGITPFGAIWSIWITGIKWQFFTLRLFCAEGIKWCFWDLNRSFALSWGRMVS